MMESNIIYNTKDLENSFIEICNLDDRANAIDFYKSRGYVFNYSTKYSGEHAYIRTEKTRSGRGLTRGYRERKNILCIGHKNVTLNALPNRYFEENFLNSNSKKDMNTLTKLKFDRFIEEEGESIVTLSEEADATIKVVDHIGLAFGNLYGKINKLNDQMARMMDIGDKEKLEEVRDELDNILDIFKTPEFEALSKAFEKLEKVIAKK